MTESPTRMFLAFGLLVLIWIGVYWWWEPRADPRISFADNAGPGPLPEEPGPRAADPAPKATEVASPGGGVVPPSFVDYTIREGDRSLEDVARRFYGTPDRWGAIARANPLMDPQRLRVGRTIRVPADPGNIQGKPVPTEQPVAAESRKTVEYTILDGDTLSTISRRFYGTTKHASLIYQHNRNRLKLRSPDAIRAGQVLVIPPLE